MEFSFSEIPLQLFSANNFINFHSLEDSLLKNPYQTWQIVQTRLDGGAFKEAEINKIKELCDKTLFKLIETSNENEDNISKLCCLISSVQLEKYFSLERLRTIVTSLLKHLKPEYFSVIYLSLVSRENLLIINDLIQQETAKGFNNITLKSIILNAILKQKHFLEIILINNLKIFDPKINQCLLFIDLITSVRDSNLNDIEEYNLSKIKNIISEINIDNFSNFLQSYLYEIKRQINLQNFLIKKSSNQLQIQNTFNIIDLLYENPSLLNTLDYTQLNNLIKTNHEIRIKIIDLKGNNVLVQQNNIDCEIFDLYTILTNYLNIIFLDPTSINYNEIIDNYLIKIRNLLRSINNNDEYINMLENIFSLLFLRIEHVNNSNQYINIKKLNQTKLFICSNFILEKILNSLKLSITQRKYLDNFVKTERYLIIKKYINDGIWRLTLLKKIKNNDNKMIKFIIYNTEDIRKKFKSYNYNQTKTSSDDDEIFIEKKLRPISRRKKRKRQLLHKTVDDGEKTNSYCSQTCGSTDNLQYPDCTELRFDLDENFKTTNILMDMLCSENSLIAICYNRCDLDSIKEIIKMFNMENTPISFDIKFSESLEQTKIKIREIFQKYYKKKINDEEEIIKNKTQIEIIRNVAAIGIETTKYINIIENFLQKFRIHSQTKDSLLLMKHKINYSYLNLYIDEQLQATIVVDFLLSLDTKYDTNVNLLNLITKHWDQNGILTQEINNIGYFGFINKIIESINQYKKIREENIGIERLLIDECYSLDITNIIEKLEREKIFKEILNKENQLDDCLKILSQSKSKINFFHRIYIYQENIAKLIKLLSDEIIKPNDYLQYNLVEKIGEIIFTKGIHPVNIESLIANLNINLIHAITLNCCPIVMYTVIPVNIKKTIIKQILLNLKNGNTDDDEKCNFNNDEKIRNYYEINDKELLDYLKKNNFLIAFLIKEYHNFNYATLNYENNYLLNLKSIESVQKKILFYNNNLFEAALNNDIIDLKKLSKYLLKADTNDAINILENLNEYQIKENQEYFDNIKNYFYRKILHLYTDDRNILILEQINDIYERSELLRINLSSIKNSVIIERLIKTILLHCDSYKLNYEQKNYLINWLTNIKVYEEITLKINIPIENVIKLSTEIPEDIFNHLIALKEYKLLLKWSKIHPLKNYPNKFSNFNLSFAINLRHNSFNIIKNIDLLRLIETLPLDIVIKFYNKMLLQLKNLQLIKYILNYLIINTNNHKDYLKYRISMEIFEKLTKDEIIIFLPLFSRPLLIIEQYLMNSKFDILNKIMLSIKPLLLDQSCNICYENRKNILEMKSNSDPKFKIDETTLLYYTDQTDDFILINIDYDHNNGEITEECIDTLLRMYATKSLDFRITELQSSNEFMSQTQTDLMSLDSLYDTFIMPKEPVTKDKWISDDETTICMCCKRSIFTMLTRRHHCRFCGRVICHSCSINRMKIPTIYDEILVRVCLDCFKQTENTQNNKKDEKSSTSSPKEGKSTADNFTGWQLSGNLKHDNIVRDEFCYEYAPSVSLCLSILTFHSTNPEYSYFLLYHCKKFQNLLRPLQPGYPNPEIDYTLVTRILHCLALAAKVHSGSSGCDQSECNTMIDYAEIILSIVQNGCESLLPTDTLTTMSFRKLRDSLVIAEKWCLALELSLKCGYPTTAVLASWGIASLRGGCYETAREKLSYCMTRVSTDENNSKLINSIDTGSNLDLQKTYNIVKILRPFKSPPLLSEILTIIETSYQPYHPEVQARATILLNSNTSLSSIKSSVPINEPALNIFHTLSNLKHIANGQYNGIDRTKKKGITTGVAATLKDNLKNKLTKIDENQNRKKNITKTRFYEESMYYLTTYGSHNDIIKFLMKHNQIISVLKYILLQNVDTEIFINSVFLPYLKNGNVELLINLMIDFNDTLLLWKDYILQTCRYLEVKCLFNCLYQMQILLKDPVRASMTCVKFYTMNCSTFNELFNNTLHLINAKKHLQTELELCQWEEIKVDTEEIVQSFLMKMSSKELNNHINTIIQQMEITKFLATCETNGVDVIGLLRKIFIESSGIPTLFDTLQEKIQLTVLILICGKNIEEGFGLAYRIIQDFNLKCARAYGITSNFLSRTTRIVEVERLIDCIKSNEQFNCDEILYLSVQTAVDVHGINNVQIKSSIDNLIKLVNDIGIKINCHIISGQLKSAYLIAVQHNRLNDIKRIMKQADITNQPIIRKLCEKKLNIVKL